MSKEMEVGDRIKSAREKAGLTQHQLAEAVGVSDTAVVLWENRKNRRGIKDEHLQKVAEVLDTTVGALLGAREKPRSMMRAEFSRVSTVVVNDAEKTLLNLFRSFSQEFQLLQLAQFVECASLGQIKHFSGDEAGHRVAEPASPGSHSA
jgi:transcriptional regulator with XRE-family HTH domain